MEKIPKLNIAEQLKQDREELRKAGMLPEEKEPEFSPEEVEEIKKIAHYISERRMAGKDEGARKWQTELAKEYGLDENAFSKETIEKLLSDNGLGDKHWTPEAQKFMQDWDLGKAEEAFRNIKKASDKAGENQEVINKTGKVKVAKVSTDGRAPEFPDVPLTSKEKAKLVKAEQVPIAPEPNTENETHASGDPSYKYTQGDEQLAFSKDWKEKKYENVKPVESKKIELDPNDPVQAELLQAINTFEAKQAQIAEMRASKAGRFKSLWSALGIKTKDLSNDPEVMGLEKESKALYRDLSAKGIRLFYGDKPQLEKFLKQFDEFEVFRSAQNQEMKKRAEVAGFPENILAGFHKIGKRYSELKKWQKIAVSVAGGLAITGGVAVLGIGTFGAATVGMAGRLGIKAFGAISAGIGRKVLLDKKMMEGMDKTSEERLAEKMKMLEDYENNLDAGIAAVVNSGKVMDVRQKYEDKSLENTKKAVNLAVWSFGISLVAGRLVQESGISVESVVRKFGEHTGISLAGVKESAGNFLSVPQAHAGDVGMMGGSAADHPPVQSPLDQAGIHAEQTPLTEATQPQSGRLFNTVSTAADHPPVQSPLDQAGIHAEQTPLTEATQSQSGNRMSAGESNASVDQPHQAEYTGENNAARVSANLTEQSHTDKAGGVPDKPQGTSALASETERLNFAEQSHTENAANMQEIVSGKVGQDGNIEKISNNVIRAINKDPAAFGLDPNDPDLSVKADNLRKGMIEEFYKKKGFSSYKEFDSYVRRGPVQPGDHFKVDYDPSEKKFRLLYEGKRMRPDIFQTSPAEEISSNKPNVAVEDVKPKASVAPEDVKPRTGAVAEHQPSRSGGKNMQYETDTPDQINAKKEFALADKYQKDLRAFNAQEAARLEAVNEVANSRLYLSTRGALNQLVNGAGVGDRANFWSHSMDDWGKLLGSENYVAQDIRLTDETRVTSFNKLKNLYLILEGFHRQGFETIGECLKQAVKNPTILDLINKSVL